MHIHSAPDLFPRSINHLDLAKQAVEAGMRAIVLKCHFSMTAFRAYLIEQSINHQIRVFGGIALNHFVGGLNSSATEVALKAGGRIVWMPTITATNHLKFYGSTGFKTQKPKGGAIRVQEGISLVKNGRILPEVEEILKLIADANAILSTGHCSIEESQILVDEAKSHGITKIIITHPELGVTDMSIEVQKELAKKGAFMERLLIPLLPLWYTLDIETMVRRIKEVGIKHSILSTDLGQRHNPLPTDGYRMFIQMLLENGVSFNEIEVMAQQNPTELLDLDDKSKVDY
jgi:hypothetical protein